MITLAHFLIAAFAFAMSALLLRTTPLDRARKVEKDPELRHIQDLAAGNARFGGWTGIPFGIAFVIMAVVRLVS